MKKYLFVVLFTLMFSIYGSPSKNGPSTDEFVIGRPVDMVDDTIIDYLARKNIDVTEGHCLYVGRKQIQHFKAVVRRPEVKLVAEIGFNAGHSSNIFLETNKQCKVYAFDIMEHPYAYDAKDYTDAKYPNRHFLIPGDSLETVPKFHKMHPEMKFDVIFIDGGHTHKYARGDMFNVQKLAHKDTIILIDNLELIGVKKGFADAMKAGLFRDVKWFVAGRYRWIQAKYNLENEQK